MVHIGFDRRAFVSFLFVAAFGGLILGSVYAVQKFPQFRSKASVNAKPQAIEVVNITDTSVTLFWITNEPTAGFVSFGETFELGKTRLDDRDLITGENQKYRTHLVTLSKLSPKTKYYYTIGVDGQTFDRDGYPFAFFTFAAPKGIPSEEKDLSGKLFLRGRVPAGNHFVTISFEKDTGELSSTLGALTETNGDFMFDLTKLRSADGTQIFSLANAKMVTADVIMHDEFGEVASQSFPYNPKDPLPVLYFSTKETSGSTTSLPDLLDIPATPSASPWPIPSEPGRINVRSFDLLNPPPTLARPKTTTPKPTPTIRPSLRLIL